MAATEIGIARVREAADIDAVRALAWEFVDFLFERYPEMRAETEAYLREQDFEGQLAAFADHFNPPTGECLLARANGEPAGTVMLRIADDAACRMNRMYVRPAMRGGGVARRLCEGIVAEARALGYREMRLTALHRHVEALPLYRSIGFETVHGNEADRRVIHMRLAL